MNLPIFIVYYDLGLGGIQRKIVDIVNFLAENQSDLGVYILLRRKKRFSLKKMIKNKKIRIIYYPDWLKLRIPFFFPVFILYHVWKLKPKAILSFSDAPSLSAIWSKLLFFGRKIRVVINEDPNAPLSKQISSYRFASVRHFLIRIFYPFAEKVIVVNKLFLEDIINNYHLPLEKIRLVPNWTYLAEKKVVYRKRIYDLIFVGRLTQEKNVEFLLRGLKQLKKSKENVSFCLVGGGRLKKELKERVRCYHLGGSVFFTGPTLSVEKHLSKAKVLVLASQSEGCPIAALEAMALEIPVLSSNYPAVAEIIEDGETGLIYDNLSDFVDKALQLLQNHKQRKKIGRQARKYVKEYHSPENIKFYLKELRVWR